MTEKNQTTCTCRLFHPSFLLPLIPPLKNISKTKLLARFKLLYLNLIHFFSFRYFFAGGG